MKKLILIACLLATSTGMLAQEKNKIQWAVKPMVGATLAKVTGDDYETDYKFGFAGGAEVIFQPSFLKRFSVSAGVIYSMQGWQQSKHSKPYYTMDIPVGVPFSTSKHITMHLDYLNVPLMINYEVLKNLQLKAGLQIGYVLRAKSCYTLYTLNAEDVELDLKSGMEPWNLSLPFGLSYSLSNGLTVDFRYQLGLTYVERTDMGYWHNLTRGHNSTFMLTLGYQIKL